MNPLSDLERLVAAIEKQGANIAPTYQEYMPIAFAIANDCGEAGRTFFHRICRMSEKYVSTEADKLYDHALKGGNGRNGLGSVFHLADLAGVRLDKSLAEAGKLSNFQTFTPPSHTHTCTHEEQSVKNVPPAFPEYPWPAFLKRMIDRGDTPAQKDILLLGGITVLGATLNKSIRISYGRKFYYPCLQTFIVAPPASGKGALAWTRRLAEPIHEAMMANYRQRHKAYREEKSRWDSLGKKKSDTPEPEMPPLKMFLIAGNNSGTGVLENLIEADGIGLICETEADTVSTAIGTEHGHWSDTLRKCHDHERLAFNRRTNREYRECPASYLSVLLSGTRRRYGHSFPRPRTGCSHANCSTGCHPSTSGRISSSRATRTWIASSPIGGSSGKCSWTTCVRGSISYNSISPTRKRSDSTAASHAYSGTPAFPTDIRCEAPWPGSLSISAGSLPWWPSYDRWRISSSHKPFSILSFQSSIVPASRLPPRSRRRTYETVSFLP